MNLDLAEMYGTPGVEQAKLAQQEDLEKSAQAELFVKLAADNGIDLNQLTDDQIGQLWGDTFGVKLAGEHEDEDEDKDDEKDDSGDKAPPFQKKEDKSDEEEKEAAANAEFAAQKEWQEKVAQHDYLGRLMAHAYVSELNSIGEQIEKQAAANMQEEPTAHTKKIAAASTSAIDMKAVDLAIEKAAAAGFDRDQAEARVYAVATLGGPGESEKIAAATTVDQAVDIRSLEFLEAAGYEVNWG